MRARRLLRSATRTVLATTSTVVLTATTALLVLPATPASAAVTVLANRDDGDDPGPGLSVLQTIGLFVVIPVGLFVVIALLVVAPSMARGPRYRPGVGWWAAPVWFNGPDDADRAVRDAAGATSQGGGASARW